MTRSVLRHREPGSLSSGQGGLEIIKMNTDGGDLGREPNADTNGQLRPGKRLLSICLSKEG